MTSLTEHYLRSCSGKKVEPFFGFIEHTAERKVDADVDFVSPNGWSLFALSMKSVSDCNLVHFRIGRLKEKAALHPPTQSQRLLNFRRLAAQFPMTDLTEAMIQRMTLGVAAMISTSPQLKYLSLQNIVIGPKGALAFSPILALAPQLQHISFEGSMIGDSGLDILVEPLCRLPALTVLNLTSCDLTDRSAKHLGTLLKSSASRNANYNWAASLRSSEGTVNTAASGDGKSGLTKLLLSDNFLGDKSAAVLATSLESDDSLLTLGLTNNTIMAEGVNHLLSALSRNRVLSVLNLSGNPGALMATDSLREYGLITVTGLSTDSDEAGCVVVRSNAAEVGNAAVRPQPNIGRVASTVSSLRMGAKAANRAQYVDPASSGPTPRGSSPVDALPSTAALEYPQHPNQHPAQPFPQGGFAGYGGWPTTAPGGPSTYPVSGYPPYPYPSPYPHPYPYPTPYATYPGYPPNMWPWAGAPHPGFFGGEMPSQFPPAPTSTEEPKRQKSTLRNQPVTQHTPATLQELINTQSESPRPSSKGANDDDQHEVEPVSAQALHEQQLALLKMDGMEGEEGAEQHLDIHRDGDEYPHSTEGLPPFAERGTSPLAAFYDEKLPLPATIPSTLQQHIDLVLESAIQPLVRATEEAKRALSIQLDEVTSLKSQVKQLQEELVLSQEDQVLLEKGRQSLSQDVADLKTKEQSESEKEKRGLATAESDLKDLIQQCIANVRQSLPVARKEAIQTGTAPSTGGAKPPSKVEYEIATTKTRDDFRLDLQKQMTTLRW